MKVIVAHPFQQHSFAVANAIKNSEIDIKYVTTVYLKKYTITYLLSKIAKGAIKTRILGRRTEGLSDEDVIVLVEWANLILLLLQRIDKSKKIYNYWYWKTIDLFNHALLKIVKKEKPDAIIVYDTVSASFIRNMKKEDIKTKIILDMSAPYVGFMKKMYIKEYKENPALENCDFSSIWDINYSRKQLYSDYELENADCFLVASELTEKSLLDSGVIREEAKIHKCIYGMNNFDENCLKLKDKKIIKIAFIGKVCVQKGAYRLFNAIDKVFRKDIEFHFYGEYEENSLYYEKYKELCFFHGHIPHNLLLKELKCNDVVVFPSLADGFGLSVTEGLLRNNICLCSVYSGVSELIQDGINGYIFDPFNEEELIDLINRLEKKNLKKMQCASKITVKQYTIENYNNQVVAAVKDCII